MDSPSGRPPGQFHWDSTMWHELSHVYVLAMTNSRVPRWFTEGLAVYEETGNGHPEWGDRLDPETINAIKNKKLLPIAEIDRGFIHPTYPAQVIVSYYQAGKICNFIEQKWGYDKLLAMIHDFAELTPTPQVIEKEFKMKPEEFDKQFFAWLEAQTKHHGRWLRRMEEAASSVLNSRSQRKAVGRRDQEGRAHPRSVSGLRRGGQRLRISVGSVPGQGRQGRRRWRSWRRYSARSAGAIRTR